MTPHDPIAHLLKQRIGLDAQAIGIAAIERAVRQRLSSLGLVGREAYWPHLQSSATEQQALIEAVVVPETWFFRYPESFQALTTLARQPELAGRTLRLLSAPCASGEEPYSMAMALLDSGLPASQFSIDAVDVSAPLLERARHGHYGRNAFRAESSDFRSRHFTATATGHQVHERLLQQVRFRQANLLQPATLVPHGLYDVIFCRNVLIYFDVPTQEAVVRTLLGLLQPHGYLFVGPAEASLLSRLGLQAVNMPLCFAFQTWHLRAATATRPSVAVVRAPTRAALNTVPAAPPVPRVRSVTATLPVVTPVSAPLQGLPRLIELANAGHVEEALRYGQQLWAQQAPAVDLCHWLGLLHDSLGNTSSALEFYRKALYLQPQHTETLLHLAALLAKLGDQAGAQRLQARAARGGSTHG